LLFKRLASVLSARRSRSVADCIGAVDDVPDVSIGETSGTSHCKPSITSGQQPTDIPLTEKEAVRAFFFEMMEWVAGDEMTFREVANNYKALSHMSPMLAPMSDKLLSQHLVGLGCRRRKAYRDGTRPTMIRFPEHVSDKVVSIRRASS
jgi:hypothetical protein